MSSCSRWTFEDKTTFQRLSLFFYKFQFQPAVTQRSSHLESSTKMPPPTPGMSCPSVSVTSISNGATAWFWMEMMMSSNSQCFTYTSGKNKRISSLKQKGSISPKKRIIFQVTIFTGVVILLVKVLHHKKKTENMFQRVLGNLENHGKPGLFPKKTQFQTCRGSSVVGLHCMAPLRFLGDLHVQVDRPTPHVHPKSFESTPEVQKPRLRYKS